MSIENIAEYLKSQGFDPDVIEPKPDILSIISDKLDNVISAINSIYIPDPPEPINHKPDINSSSSKIVNSIKSINIPKPINNTNELNNIKSALTEISNLLSDKSSLLSVAESVNTLNQDNNSIGSKIITQLELTKSEIESTNTVTGKSVDNLKQIISTLKSMDTSKILKEIVKSVDNQDKTNKIIVKGLDNIVSKANETRNYHFTEFERDENGWLMGLKAYQIK